MDVSAYQESLLQLCNLLPNGATVLELACGPGNITAWLLARRPDLKILATDMAPEMLRIARINNPSAHFMELDLREIRNVDRLFNAIVCGFGVPYLNSHECGVLISDCIEMLQPGGHLYFSFMEGDHSLSGLQKSSSGNELFINIHEEAFFLSALAGFCKVVHSSRVPNATGYDLILIAEKYKTDPI